MSTPATAALSLPEALETLKRHVLEDMTQDDVSAIELVEALTVSWALAARVAARAIGVRRRPV